MMRPGITRRFRRTASGFWRGHAAKLLTAVIAQPRVKRLLSTGHFSVDGTLIEAWASMRPAASMKSFLTEGRPGRTADGGRRAVIAWRRCRRGQKRSNETHASTTDPEARPYRKGPGKEVQALLHGTCADREPQLPRCRRGLSEANGHAERIAALHMIEPRADRPRPFGRIHKGRFLKWTKFPATALPNARSRLHRNRIRLSQWRRSRPQGQPETSSTACSHVRRQGL